MDEKKASAVNTMRNRSIHIPEAASLPVSQVSLITWQDAIRQHTSKLANPAKILICETSSISVEAQDVKPPNRDRKKAGNVGKVKTGFKKMSIGNHSGRNETSQLGHFPPQVRARKQTKKRLSSLDLELGKKKDINEIQKRRWSLIPTHKGSQATSWTVRFRRFMNGSIKSTVRAFSRSSEDYHSIKSDYTPPASHRNLPQVNAPDKITLRRPSEPPGNVTSGDKIVSKAPSTSSAHLAPLRASSVTSLLPIPPTPSDKRDPFWHMEDSDRLRSEVTSGTSLLSDKPQRHRSLPELVTLEPQLSTSFELSAAQQRNSIGESLHETIWRRRLSTPSLSSSFTEDYDPAKWFRSSSLWYPRFSCSSIQDAKKSIRASLPETSIEILSPINYLESEPTSALDARNMSTAERRQCLLKWKSPCNTTVLPSRHSDIAERQMSSQITPALNSLEDHDQRRPSISKKDHQDIYRHPFFRKDTKNGISVE